MTKHWIAISGKRGHIVSDVPKKILDAVAKGNEYYTDIQKVTQLPSNSLYVYIARLKARKLVRTSKDKRSREVKVSLVNALKWVEANAV